MYLNKKLLQNLSYTINSVFPTVGPQKADKKLLDAKVNTKLFDKTTEEINNMIKEILDKLAGHVSKYISLVLRKLA